jgi:hypothetical protein
MSMNFYISGKRDITVNKTGVVETQHCNYQPWQTPSAVTREILAAMLPVEAYKAWVMSISKDEQEPIYAQGDIYGDGEPIGHKTINVGKEECTQVDEWIAAVIELGYELEFYTL